MLDLEHMRYQRRLRHSAGAMLYCASIAYFVALFVGLVAFREAVIAGTGRDISWSQLLDALGQTGLLPLFLAMVLGQIAFGTIAYFSGSYLFRTSRAVVNLPIGTIITGAFALGFSILLFGGIIGAFGAGMSMAAGIVALLASRPRAVAWGYPTRWQPPWPPPPRT